jgi:hypothetical protein
MNIELDPINVFLFGVDHQALIVSRDWNPAIGPVLLQKELGRSPLVFDRVKPLNYKWTGGLTQWGGGGGGGVEASAF